MTINNDYIQQQGLEIDTLKKYKLLASKIQKAYNYVTYILVFENPFRVSR
jgi:hypothetical protein